MSRFNKNTLQVIANIFNSTTRRKYPIGSTIKDNLYFLYQEAYSQWNATRYLSEYDFNLDKIEQAAVSFIDSVKEAKELNDSLSSVVTTKDIKRELEYLVKTFEEVKIRKVKNQNSVKISVVTKDIVLSYLDDTVNFGKFQIIITFNYSGKSNKSHSERAYFKSLKNENILHPHPHINGNSLCFGEGRVAFNRCVELSLISESFDILLAILSEYNPSSPYREFRYFVTNTCSLCNQPTGANYLKECYLCGQEILCPDCYKQNIDENRLCCKNCLKICDCGYWFTKKEENDYCLYCRSLQTQDAHAHDKQSSPATPITTTEEVTSSEENEQEIVTSTESTTLLSHFCCSCNIGYGALEELQEHENNLYCPRCLFVLISSTEGLD